MNKFWNKDSFAMTDISLCPFFIFLSDFFLFAGFLVQPVENKSNCCWFIPFKNGVYPFLLSYLQHHSKLCNDIVHTSWFFLHFHQFIKMYL